MYIKEIEFLNFKSFGKKVKIPFFDDFTTISGPNGSGKSNIIDGILFVLGLSSSRTLRAEKLTDLIYNGDKKKRSDFAQVTIKFDNEDREMPVDEDEITISRKIRETNNGYYSYFYFNGKAVSLSEVHNYLAKARITPEGYNVVMQGDVTRIITMTPVERRKIIDEIAGVAEFDNKKERALNELEIVKERIERADILIEEVDKQLEKLKDEKDQAVKYQSLQEEKMKYEGYVLLAKLKDAKKELDSILEDIESKTEEHSQLEATVRVRVSELNEMENALNELTASIQKMGEEEQIRIKKDIEEIKGNISRNENNIEIAENEINEADIKRRKAFLEIDGKKNEVREIDSKLSDETLRKESVISEISDKKTERMILQSRIADVDEKFAIVRDELARKRTLLEEVKSEKNELIRQEDRLLDSLRRKSSQIREIENEIEDARNKVNSSQSDTKSTQYDIEQLNKKIEEHSKDLDDLESNRFQIKAVITDLETTLRKHQQDFAMLEARVRAAEDTSNYSRAVDMVIKEKKHHGLPGIYGTIAELGSVDHKYATAMGVAAGGRMQAVVVETDEDASRAISFLKQQRAGRATFLPLNKMEDRRPYKNVSDLNGIIGYAIDLIDFESRFQAAFWYVFRDTLIVDTMQNARKLIGGYRMVTLEGEVIEKSGAMTGGSTKRSGLSFAASEKDKLVKIAEKITEFDSRRNAAIKKLDAIESHISSVNRDVSEIEKEISKKQLVFEEIEGRSERLEELIRSRNEELEDINREQEELRAEMDRVIGSKNDKEKSQQELEGSIDVIQEKLSDSQIPQLNKKADLLDEELLRLEGRVRDIEADINALNLDHQYASSHIENNRELVKELDSKKDSYRQRISQLKDEIGKLETELAGKRAREIELTDHLKEMQKKRSDLKSEYDIAEKNVSGLRSELDTIARSLMALEATRSALEEQKEDLVEELKRRNIEQTEDVPDYDAVTKRIASIERAMQRLEPVNMRAIDEYENVEKRSVDLKTRRAILFNEREQILDRIDQYDTLKKDTFMETFNGINEPFKDIFNELSDGMGELVLDNAEDPFAGGMTLKAQPKEKTLQRLEAMSGGEKSLTALAFIFAIQQYRPAPFYAFDEIDMFLDGSNAEKVSRRVKKAGTNAQFIVVSLRKPMIEAAQRTIGVTMQENNITSITGVKLR